MTDLARQKGQILALAPILHVHRVLQNTGFPPTLNYCFHGGAARAIR